MAKGRVLAKLYGEPVGVQAQRGQHPGARGFSPVRGRATAGDPHPMAWFLRAIEQTDGRWRCSHGRTVYDQHDVLPDALEHLRVIAETR